MATQPTNLPVPSESPRDLKFNAGKIDEFVTSMQREYEDRFGNKHYTIEGMRWIAQQAISAFGYITLDSFEDGNTLTLPNQVLRLEATGEYYRWDGAFPKDVPAGSTPETTGGVGPGSWIGVGDASLRADLSAIDGENIIGGATYAQIRAYSGDATYIKCIGRSNTFDHASGIFILDPNDTTSNDDDGTILVDSNGGRWKRDYNGTVNVAWFGIYEDDDSGATTSMLQALFENSKTRNVFFPKYGSGKYYTKDLYLRSDSTLTFAPGITLQALPGLETNLIGINGSKNVSVFGNGAYLDCIRDEYTSGELPMCIYLYSAENVTIDNVKCRYAGGDGLFIYGNASDGTPPSRNIFVKDIEAYECSRNGISISNAINVIVDGAVCSYTNTNGKGSSSNGPWAGIDIEPDIAEHFLQNITIRNLRTIGNYGSGLQFTLPALNSPISITVDNFHSESDGVASSSGLQGTGIRFACFSESQDNNGYIKINNAYVKSPYGSGVRFQNWKNNQCKTYLENITVYDPGVGSGGNANKCGLYLSNTSPGETPGEKGNIYIKDFRTGGTYISNIWLEGDSDNKVCAEIIGGGGFNNILAFSPSMLVTTGIVTNKALCEINQSIQGRSAFSQVNKIILGGSIQELPPSSLCVGMEVDVINMSGSDTVISIPAPDSFLSSTYSTYPTTPTTVTIPNNKIAKITSLGSGVWLIS